MAIQCTGKASYPLREGREFWALALELQRQSGLTMAAFCRREGLSDKAFWRWKRKLSLPIEPAAAPAVFAPVTVTDRVTELFKTSRTPADHLQSSTDGGSGDPCSLSGGGRRGDRPRLAAPEPTDPCPTIVELRIHLANGRCVQACVPAETLPLRCVLEAVEGLS